MQHRKHQKASIIFSFSIILIFFLLGVREQLFPFDLLHSVHFTRPRESTTLPNIEQTTAALPLSHCHIPSRQASIRG